MYNPRFHHFEIVLNLVLSSFIFMNLGDMKNILGFIEC